VTDREVVPAAASRSRGRVREFVARRSGTQRVGAVAAVLVLASAPFGGLRSVADEDIQPLRLAKGYDVGPFEISVDRVRQLRSLPPVIEEDPGSRILAIGITVTNHTDRPETVKLAYTPIGGKHTGRLPWDDGAIVRVFGVDDAVELTDGEFINPGQSYELALLLRQDPATDLDALTLELNPYDLQEVDPQTLDPDRWILDETPVAEGHVPVEVVDE